MHKFYNRMVFRFRILIFGHLIIIIYKYKIYNREIHKRNINSNASICWIDFNSDGNVLIVITYHNSRETNTFFDG